MEQAHRRQFSKSLGEKVSPSWDAIAAAGLSRVAETRLTMEIVHKEGRGRCAIAMKTLQSGEILLEEKASLFWKLESDEVKCIIEAYDHSPDKIKVLVDALTDNINDHSNELDALVDSWKQLLQSYGYAKDSSASIEYLSLLLRAHFNAHAVQSPPGACLFVVGATLNHSCSPNTIYRCEAHTIRFKVTEVIEQGTEMTAAYLDAMTMLKPSSYRQRVLLVSKGFLCRCERCSTTDLDVLRPVHCARDSCDGIALPGNDSLPEVNDNTCLSWQCLKCNSIIDERRKKELQESEKVLYNSWQIRDQTISEGKAISRSHINDAITQASALLHPSHFIVQLDRILAIELGAAPGGDRITFLSHAFTFADWLHTTFHKTIPNNLLGTMTGALAALFNRSTYLIEDGLDVDRVLKIIKAVLPIAKLSHGKDGAYPVALENVLTTYKRCSSLICKNTGRLSTCGRCESAFYCSRSCQVFHYKSQGHKTRCLSIIAARKQLDAALKVS